MSKGKKKPCSDCPHGGCKDCPNARKSKGKKKKRK
jgi:hypothetical protein